MHASTPATATGPASISQMSRSANNSDQVVRTEKDGRNADLEGATTDGDGWADPYGPAPTVGSWFKLYWHDLVAFIFLGIVALGFLLWSPVPYRRYFAVTQQPVFPYSDVVNPEFAHPKYSQIIPIVADALVAVFAPFIAIFLVNIFGIGTFAEPGVKTVKDQRRGTCFGRRGSFWNASNGYIGVIYAVMTGCVLQIIIKIAIPGLRPHFLTVCDPQLDNNSVNGEGYHQIYYNATVCRDHTNPDRAKKIANAMQSFPSGHSVAAWAGLFYLSLYLNAHLKIFSNHHPSYWKLLVFLMPLLAATLLVGALYLDMSHNWYDIVVGSLLGTAMAILSYRMCFAAVWDFRWNHVPLVRGSRNGRDDERGLAYSMKEMEEWAGGCATRRAGWGVGRAYACGAPGDCSTAFNVSGNSAHGSHHQQSGPIVDGGGEPGVVA